MTTNKRKIEIFSAGCPACKETLEFVNNIACPSCEIEILDMKSPDVAKRAKELGIKNVPAVAVNGLLVSCCSNRGPTKKNLRTAGIGKPL